MRSAPGGFIRSNQVKRRREYDDEPKGGPSGEAQEFLEVAMARTGAIVIGRWMYETANHWGEKNPWGIPVFVVTHRPEEEPGTGEFKFVGGFDEAIERARETAGDDKDVGIGGGADVIRQGIGRGADVIRQGIGGGIVDELAIIVAPVILGGGKALFEGFDKSLDLEQAGVRQMEWATVIEYRVKK